MDKLEKVIKGLECCLANGHNNCPYESTDEGIDKVTSCTTYLMRDALALLKAQQPRVMTLEEVMQHNNQDGCVWFEQPTYNAVAAFVMRDEDYTEIISPYILGEPINHGYMANKFYGKAWRCWTSRPTDEQREAEAWG